MVRFSINRRKARRFVAFLDIDRDRDTVLGVKRRLAATEFAAILHVVVHEECIVQQLNRNGRVQGLLTAATQGSASRKAKRRAQSFPTSTRIGEYQLVEVRWTVPGDGSQQVHLGEAAIVSEDLVKHSGPT